MKTLIKYRTLHPDCPEEFKAAWVVEWGQVMVAYCRVVYATRLLQDQERRSRLRKYLLDRCEREWGEDMSAEVGFRAVVIPAEVEAGNWPAPGGGS